MQLGRKLGYIGIDQYGQVYKNLKHPRKDLLARLDRKHAAKMYEDIKITEHGKIPQMRQHHIGYVIAGCWIRVYTISDWGKIEGR